VCAPCRTRGARSSASARGSCAWCRGPCLGGGNGTPSLCKQRGAVASPVRPVVPDPTHEGQDLRPLEERTGTSASTSVPDPAEPPVEVGLRTGTSALTSVPAPGVEAPVTTGASGSRLRPSGPASVRRGFGRVPGQSRGETGTTPRIRTYEPCPDDPWVWSGDRLLRWQTPDRAGRGVRWRRGDSLGRHAGSRHLAGVSGRVRRTRS